MKLEIVSHCWHYSRLLSYQLSSLCLYPPNGVEVVATVFYAEKDTDTRHVLEYFVELSLAENLTVRPWSVPVECLLRRSIGRNLAAQATTADWVWFTDCDYLFGEECLEELPAALKEVPGPLAFPRVVYHNATHADGDRLVQKISAPGVYDVDCSQFVAKRLNRAIGGVQLVPGDVARANGYLPDTRWQQPATRLRFCRCREDRVYRAQLGTRGHPIKLPGVYRIRHSVCGRQHENVSL